jgi:site-specific DNA-methyltransferase (adenine-specific)
VPKKKKSIHYPPPPAEQINPLDGVFLEEPMSREVPGRAKLPLCPEIRAEQQLRPTNHPSTINSQPSTGLHLVYENASNGVWLYNDNCLAVMDAIAAKYPEGRFDCIFADPPYFLSNGGITCHAGKMVKVDKGDWDKSRGWEWNHEFNRAWLERCQRVLKPNGTIWVTGTHHVIFSVGFAMQQLGYKILNDIAWEKPNPPPNLSCRYFTHSTETIIWAAKNDKSKHTFNYPAMKAVTGKQMKTVWRKEEWGTGVMEQWSDAENPNTPPLQNSNSAPEKEGMRGKSEKTSTGANEDNREKVNSPSVSSVSSCLSPIWTMSAPGRDEKQHGKHPTQKPVALIERCLLAATNPHDLVLDPFMGAGTTAIAAFRTKRHCVGIDMDEAHVKLAAERLKTALEENTDLFTPPPPPHVDHPENIE